ncbi:DUF6011 domain-containing protein [Mycobacterium marinum]|uniref:DUF6011 domain-containing protein n=1 Tax=Mycobacterium marinum TaxID=1781 RepID=UPI003B28B283
MPQRKRPTPPQNRPSPNATNGYTEFTGQLGLQPHEPLTVDDRADLAVLNAAAERGFKLAVRCTRCKQWLVAPASVRRHLGPVCATKAVADA